ncbi:MAG: hypothetical protein LBC39_05080 [Methanobrevibacter sp.]|jgi:hypothetical protein|nr:hypothetical protein [Candidatus Methanovirga aequatorialis]
MTTGFFIGVVVFNLADLTLNHFKMKKINFKNFFGTFKVRKIKDLKIS